MEPVVHPAFSLRQTGSVHLYREQHDRVALLVEFDVTHPGDICGSALIQPRQIPRTNRSIGTCRKRAGHRAVALIDFAFTNEPMIEAVVIISRVVFSSDKMDRVFPVASVFGVGAVTVPSVEQLAPI